MLLALADELEALALLELELALALLELLLALALLSVAVLLPPVILLPRLSVREDSAELGAAVRDERADEIWAEVSRARRETRGARIERRILVFGLLVVLEVSKISI